MPDLFHLERYLIHQRLGPGQHTQYSLKPLQQLTQTITTVALGQDHTLAVTKSGELLSWGLNRFGQLGYVVETVHPGAEPIQSTPKRILGPLKKDVVVKGVAACRSASACWTENEVFTWGTNHGQLGSYPTLAKRSRLTEIRVRKEQPGTPDFATRSFKSDTTRTFNRTQRCGHGMPTRLARCATLLEWPAFQNQVGGSLVVDTSLILALASLRRSHPRLAYTDRRSLSRMRT